MKCMICGQNKPDVKTRNVSPEIAKRIMQNDKRIVNKKDIIIQCCDTCCREEK